MVLDKSRSRVDPFLTVIAKRFTNINPDVLTWLALLFSIIAGGFFYLSNPLTELQNYFLFFAALFVLLNGLFDAIDGKVAKLANKGGVSTVELCFIAQILSSPWHCVRKP